MRPGGRCSRGADRRPTVARIHPPAALNLLPDCPPPHPQPRSRGPRWLMLGQPRNHEPQKNLRGRRRPKLDSATSSWQGGREGNKSLLRNILTGTHFGVINQRLCPPICSRQRCPYNRRLSAFIRPSSTSHRGVSITIILPDEYIFTNIFASSPPPPRLECCFLAVSRWPENSEAIFAPHLLGRCSHGGQSQDSARH